MKNRQFLRFIASASFILSTSYVFAGSPSTWTGVGSSNLSIGGNWTNGTPYSGTAIFNGNGVNSPLSNQDAGIAFDQMQFTAATQIAIITGIETIGSSGIIVSPSVIATFDVYEHQPLFYPAASLRIDSGPAGSGGGTVNYNLDAYGQLYAYSGSADTTIVNVTMTGGNNYFEIDGAGSNIFDNVSSDQSTDQIVIQSGANLTLRGSSANTITGVISGDGSLVKTNTSVLTLGATNTFTGGATISAGVLQLNGSLASALTVNAGASVKGNGTVHGNLLLYGTASPGNSIGTLTVDTFTATSSSLFLCEIDSSGSSDKIVATGSMLLNGSLQIVPLDLAFTSAKTYTILQAGSGISGTFSSVQSSVAALRSLSYGANGVILTYLPLSAIGLQNDSTANCYTALFSSDANFVSGQILSLSFQDMQQAFRQMQPSLFSAQAWTQLSNALLISSSYSKHLKEFCLQNRCSKEYKSNVWIDAVGQWQEMRAEHNQYGFSDWTTGFSLGADTSYQQYRFGGALSYTYSGIDWEKSIGDGHMNSCYGGVYGSWNEEIGYVIFSALGGYNRVSSTRNLSFGNFHRTAEQSHNGWELLTGLEGGAYFKVDRLSVGPFGRFSYVSLWQDGYLESGANSLNLFVQSRQDQLIQSQAGLVFTRNYNCKPQYSYGSFIPRFEISYINQTPLAKSNYSASFENSSCQFSTSGWNFEHNLFAVGAAITYLNQDEKMGVSLQYDGQFGSRYYNQDVNLLFHIKF